MKNFSILKKGSLYLFGNFFNKAIAFITIPIFTRILTTEEYGIVNTYLSWVSLLSVIIGLALNNTIRNAYIDKNKELEKYVSFIFFVSGITFIIICILYFIIGYELNIDYKLGWICLIESFSISIINVLIIKYMMEERVKKRTILMILPNFLGVIFSIICIYLLADNKYYGRIFSSCIINSIFGISIMLYYFIKYKTFFNKEYFLYALPISIPLIFHGISINILNTSDRSVINYFCGASEAGIYSLIYNISMVSQVVIFSAEAVWIPRLTKDLIEKNHKKINKEIILYIWIIVFFIMFLISISPELILILGGYEYLIGLNMVFPLIFSTYIMFLYSIYVNIEYYYKNTKLIAFSTILSAILNLILNIIFVPFWGAISAAYTTLISYGVSFILHYKNLRKINSEIANLRIMVLPSIIIIFYSFFISNFFDNALVRYISIMIVILIYIFEGKKIYYNKI